MLLALAIRRAIDQGRREFDLLADDAFYKQQLTPLARPLVHLRAARPFDYNKLTFSATGRSSSRSRAR